MRKRFAPAAAIALAALAAPASAASCRLSTADCELIAREQALEDAAREHDAATFAPGMPSYPRGLELIKRHYARLIERIRHLPVRIGNEAARMSLCDAVEAANAQDPGSAAVPAACR